MVNLIIVVISIALLAAVIAASVNYIPLRTKLKVREVGRIERQLEALTEGIESYQESIRDPATGEVDFGAPRSNLMTDLAPQHVFRPRPVQGDWIAGIGDYLAARRPWVCLRPPADGWEPYMVEAIAMAAGKLPVSSAFVADTCGATADGAGGDRLTVWFNRRERHPGYQIQQVSPPAAAVIYDAERAANVRFAAEGVVTTDTNETGTKTASVTAEIRAPGGTWQVVDTWSVELSGRTMSLEVPAHGLAGFVQTRQTGNIEAMVPGGWEFRLQTTTTDSATVTLTDGQLQFLW